MLDVAQTNRTQVVFKQRYMHAKLHTQNKKNYKIEKILSALFK